MQNNTSLFHIPALFVLLLAGTNLFSASVSIQRVPEKGLQPQVARGKDGAIHLIYFKGESKNGNLFYAKRESGSSRFSRAIRVNRRDGSAVAVGTIRGAHIALGRNDRVHVAWMGSRLTARKSPGHKRPLSPMLYTRMNDAGKGFEAERNLVNYAWGLDGGGSVAADSKGNVYVFWHADPSLKERNEEGRTIFLASSKDGGKTFARERDVVSVGKGTCGCCGMRAFVDSSDRVYALYRTANRGGRDMTLLQAPAGATKFVSHPVNPWLVFTCPMSSSAFAEAGSTILLGTERQGKVLIKSLDPKREVLTDAFEVSLGRRAKHPLIATNDRGEVLIAWQEGASFNQGGELNYQIFDAAGKTIQPPKVAGKVARFSLAAVFADRDGNFEILF